MTIYHALAVGFVLAVILAMAGFRAFARCRHTARMIETTPVASIQAAPDDYVALTGTVEALHEGTLRAPLTDTACCWYRYRIEEQGAADKEGWTIIQRGQSVWPFLLRDASGLCAVDPADAEFFPTDRSVWFGETLQPTDRNPARERWSDPAEIRSPKDPMFVNLLGKTHNRYRYVEERIYPGDRLHVLGEFERGTEPYVPPEDESGEEEEAGEPLPVWEDRDKALLCRVEETPHWIAAVGSPERYPFLISVFPLGECVRYQRGGAYGALFMGLLGAAAAVALFLTGVYLFLKPPAH